MVPQRSQGSHTQSASPGHRRWVCVAPSVQGSSPFEPLAGNQAPGPRTEGPFCRPRPARAPGPCFLFIPCCRGFNGQKLCPLPHCGDTNVHSPQGLLRRSTAEEGRQARRQRADCVLGPRERAGRAWAEAGRSQAEPRWAAAGREGQGGPRACGRGVSPGLGTPSHSLPGRGVFWMKLGCSPPPWVRNAMREGRGPCSSPGGGRQPAPAHL